MKNKLLRKIALCSLVSLGTVALGISLAGCGGSSSGTISFAVDGETVTSVEKAAGDVFTINATFTANEGVEVSGSEAWSWAVSPTTGLTLSGQTTSAVTVTATTAGTYTFTATYSVDGASLASASISVAISESAVTYEIDVTVNTSAYMQGETFSDSDLTVVRVAKQGSTILNQTTLPSSEYTVTATSTEGGSSFTLTDGYTLSELGTFNATVTYSGTGVDLTYTYEFSVTEASAAYKVVQLIEELKNGASFTVSEWSLSTINYSITLGDDLYGFTDDYFISYNAKQAYALETSGVRAFDFEENGSGGYDYTARSLVQSVDDDNRQVGNATSLDEVYDIHDVANPADIPSVSISDFSSTYEEDTEYTILEDVDASIALMKLAGLGASYGYLTYYYRDYLKYTNYEYVGLGIQVAEDNTGDTHYLAYFLFSIGTSTVYYDSSVMFDINLVGTTELDGFDDFLDTEYTANENIDTELNTALTQIRGENFSIEIDDYTSSYYGYTEKFDVIATENSIEWDYYYHYPSGGYNNYYLIFGYGKYDNSGTTNYIYYLNDDNTNESLSVSSVVNESYYTNYRPAGWFGVDDGTIQAWASFDTTAVWTKVSEYDYTDSTTRATYTETEYLISSYLITYWWEYYYFQDYTYPSSTYPSIYGWDLDAISVIVTTDSSDAVVTVEIGMYLNEGTQTSTYGVPSIDGRLTWDTFEVSSVGTTTNSLYETLVTSLKGDDGSEEQDVGQGQSVDQSSAVVQSTSIKDLFLEKDLLVK